METFCAPLALCEGNTPTTDGTHQTLWCFLWLGCYPKRTENQTIELSVISDVAVILKTPQSSSNGRDKGHCLPQRLLPHVAYSWSLDFYQTICFPVQFAYHSGVGQGQCLLPGMCVYEPWAIVCSTVVSGAGQRKHQNSASLAFVRYPVNCPHKKPVTREMFPLDHVIILSWIL